MGVLISLVNKAVFMYAFTGIILWFMASVIPPLGKPLFGYYKVVTKKGAVSLLGVAGVAIALIARHMVNVVVWFCWATVVTVRNLIRMVQGRDDLLSFPPYRNYFPQQQQKKNQKQKGSDDHDH